VWTQLLVLGVLFIVVGLPVDAIVGLTAGSLADGVLRRPTVRRRLERASALIFGGLAVRLALDTRRAGRLRGTRSRGGARGRTAPGTGFGEEQ
jgi:hypothetical protein